MRKTYVSLIVLGAALSVAGVGLAQTQTTDAASGAAAATAAAPAAEPQGAGFGDGRGPGGPGGFDGGRGGPGGPGGFDGRGGPGGDRGPGGPGGGDGRGPGGGDGRGPGGPDGRGPDGRGPGGPPINTVIPTSGDGRMVLDLVAKFCDPLMADPKGTLDKVMRGAGYEKLRANKTDLLFGGYKGPFASGAPFSVTFVGQSEANQKVCEFVLDAPKDDAQILADAITPWSNLHKPFMALRRNDLVNAGPGSLRRFTWIGFDDAQTYALNMNVETNPDGSSPFSGGDRIRIRYQITKR